VGLVYKVNPAGAETALYSFRGGVDGANPHSILTADAQGNLYGTTVEGGTTSSSSAGSGVVFKIDSTARETVLYSFTGGPDGGSPYAGVARDAAGNLYGTTSAGGSDNAGVVYKLSPGDTETVLYSFKGLMDGGSPYSGLILGAGPSFYGTAFGAYPPNDYLFPIILPEQPGVVYRLTVKP
jgi:uncharacterized repeat protein (TIGR03803 family)